jgi:peptide/nickel transport system permease protein
MARYLARRFVLVAVTIFIVSIISFIVPYLGSQDPSRTILRSRVSELGADPAAVQAIRQQLGLDQPIPVQYIRWLGTALQGDLGKSFTSRQPVFELVTRALFVSFLLALTALTVACLIGIPLGILAAMRTGRRSDSVIMLVTQGFVALPEYWIAPLGMLVFALWLGLLPVAGWNSPASVVLPASVLALRPLAYLLTVTRASMTTVLAAPYMTASRARGLSRLATVRRHGIRNAMVPVMTLFSIWLAGTIGGSVIVEVVFSIPGIGRLMWDSVVNADVPVIQGGVIAIVTMAVLINMLTDIGYAVLNPAVLVGERHG